MYYCNKCKLSTPQRCREFHEREDHARTMRREKMREIRAMLEAMTDDEFRNFNNRMVRS